MTLGLKDFDRGKFITKASGRGGPWNLHFFRPWKGTRNTHVHKITNVLFFYIWHLDLMILIGANSLKRPLEEVVSENGEFFGVLKWLQTKLMHIKLQIYLFFMTLGLHDFHGGKFITRTIGRGGPCKWRLFGPWNGN